MSHRDKDIRPSVLGGTWYPADPGDLRATVQRYLDEAAVAADVPDDIRGLVSPHAGYIYSGPVAAFAYRQVVGKHYDTVVVVAPNHADTGLDFSAVKIRGGYTTPLGVVPVDSETARAVTEYQPQSTVFESDLGHRFLDGDRAEHSLEIQLPFLQVAIGEFSLVPVVMGDQGEPAVRELAEAIAAAVQGKNALLVASSDLSHFFDSETARQLDAAAAAHISAFDPIGLLGDPAISRARVCGAGPIATVMLACRELGADTARVLKTANSYDIAGGRPHQVVGYLAAAIGTRAGSGVSAASAETESAAAAGSYEDAVTVGVDLGITAEEKETLRQVVRETLEAVVHGSPLPRFTARGGNLADHRGAFVTLEKKGQLRGCIGHIVADEPLISVVAQMARAAALEDPRFPHVRPEELPDITFDISVLTPIRKLERVEDIVIGRDGLIVSRGWARGLLLPQVAAEYGWDRETFLAQTCRKAGLPTDAWRNPETVIEVFSAEVFS